MDGGKAEIRVVMESVDNIAIPAYAAKILARLEQEGFEAYVVGGCVRDSLLGIEPGDWDITTSATPSEMHRCFMDYRVIPTGLQHGTVTILSDGQTVEVTTFRVDGEYSDNRRPDSVTFTRNLADDLSRRDFTVNALAYNPRTGVVDCHGGQKDLENRLLRCVGDPDARFREDGLRILRGARFACVLGFEIEEKTLEAMLRQKELLQGIAGERIATELNKALLGDYFSRVFLAYPELLTQVLPELAPTVGFDQRNPHHIYNVYEHTLRAVEATPKDLVVRLAVLLHDSAKPLSMTLDDKGIGHFIGHGEAGVALARRALTRLRYDNDTIGRVCLLVGGHSQRIPNNPKVVKRWLSRWGEAVFRQLLAVKKADQTAKSPELARRAVEEAARLEEITTQIIEEKQCYTLKDLAVHGGDLLSLGMPKGPAVGQTLNRLLELVMDGKLDNEKDILLNWVKKEVISR